MLAHCEMGHVSLQLVKNGAAKHLQASEQNVRDHRGDIVALEVSRSFKGKGQQRVCGEIYRKKCDCVPERQVSVGESAKEVMAGLSCISRWLSILIYLAATRDLGSNSVPHLTLA